MIDVVMCLIVFYLMVGQLALNRSAGIRVPASAQGTAGEDSSVDPTVVGVLPSGALVLDGEPIGAERLPGELIGRAARGMDRIEIRADRGVSFGSVRRVLDAARAAGIDRVDMVAERAG